MKTVLLGLFCSIVILSCTPRIQVVSLSGSNLLHDKQGLLLDNDSLSIYYSFASKRGQIHISIFNKLNEPIYVDWKHSSLIIGQDKLDYWYDVATVQLSGNSYGHRYWYYLGGTITKEDPIGFIPPQTRLDKAMFTLIPEGTLKLTGAYTLEQERSQMFQTYRKMLNIPAYSYTASQSPFAFRSYLTFSTDRGFRTEFHYDTRFWASTVKIYPKQQVLSRYDGKTTLPIRFKKPDSFYLPLPAH